MNRPTSSSFSNLSAAATILLLLVSSVVDAAVAPFPFLGRRSADRVRVGGVSVELLRSGRNDDVGRCPRRRGYEAAPHLLRQRLVDSTFRLAVMASAAAKVQPPKSMTQNSLFVNNSTANHKVDICKVYSDHRITIHF